MTNFMTRAYLAMRIKAECFMQDLKNDERGVGPLVATILIMLIVVLMVAVFWEKISTWFSEMMDKIFNTGSAGQFNTDDLG